MLLVRRVVPFPDDGDLVGAALQVAVDAVVGDVGDAVLEPADRDLAGAERRVLDPAERREPSMRSPCLYQNASGSRIDSSYMARYLASST
jgi:hypothetical protein